MKGIVLGLVMMFVAIDFAEARLSITKNTPQERVYFVTGDFMSNQYGRLIRDLRTAGRGEKIHIIIKGNIGGIDYIAEPVLAAIVRSKATVTTESRGFTASYAVDTLLRGHIVKINYSARHLFHYFFYPTRNGKKVNISISRKKMRNMLPWFSSSEVRKMERGGDITLTGKQLCARINNRKVTHGKGFCTLRGRL